jgi:hypothetical protein
MLGLRGGDERLHFGGGFEMPEYLDHYRPNLEEMEAKAADLSFNLKNIVEVFSGKTLPKSEAYRWAMEFVKATRDSIFEEINKQGAVKGFDEVENRYDVVLQYIGMDFKRLLNGVEMDKLTAGQRGLMIDVLSSWAIYKIQSYATISWAKENKFKKITLISPDKEQEYYLSDKLQKLPLSPRDKSYYVLRGGQ